MDTMERVNHSVRKRRYGARDKEKLIQAIHSLHQQGYSQVEISKLLGISRGTILRWNKDNNIFVARAPGEAGKLKSKKFKYDGLFFTN